MGKLEGKTAIVTGSCQGVGCGIALAFVKEGAKLALPRVCNIYKSRWGNKGRDNIQIIERDTTE